MQDTSIAIPLHSVCIHDFILLLIAFHSVQRNSKVNLIPIHVMSAVVATVGRHLKDLAFRKTIFPGL